MLIRRASAHCIYLNISARFVVTEIDGIANSLEKVPDKIRKKTKRIRQLTTRLVEDHIDDIRKKLRA